MLRKELLIAISNFKKKKFVYIATGILCLLIALFMNLCFIAFQSTDSFAAFFDRVDATEVSVFTPSTDTISNEDVKKTIMVTDGVDKVYQENILYMQSNVAREKDNLQKSPDFSGILFFGNNFENAEKNKAIHYSTKSNANSGKYDVFVPLSFKSLGYEEGDVITIRTNFDFQFECVVDGFMETSYYFSSIMGAVAFDMSEQGYENLTKEMNEYKSAKDMNQTVGFGCLSSVATDPSADMSELTKKLQEKLITNDATITTFAEIKEAMTNDVQLYAGVLTMFSVIIFIVVLIIFFFRISDTIKQNIQEIATMKAMGYKSTEIRVIYSIQFGLPVLVLSIIGIILSYIFTPLLGNVISGMTGVTWDIGLHLKADIITLLVILAFTILTLYLVTAKLVKISPIAAFQGESLGNKNKRELVSLETTAGSRNFVLALMTVLSEKAQTLMVVAVTCLLTFTMCFVLLLSINLTKNDNFWYTLLGEEITDYMVTFDSDCDVEEVKEKLSSMNNVDYVLAETVCYMNIEKSGGHTMNDQMFWIVDDFSKMKYMNVYSGRFPEDNKEIVVSDIQAEALGIEIGDNINVNSVEYTFNEETYLYERNEKTKSLKVVGLTQNNVNASFITFECYNEFSLDTEKLFLVFSDGNGSYDTFAKDVEQEYGKAELGNTSGFLAVEDYMKKMDKLRSTYQTPFLTIGIAMTIVTLCIVGFIITIIVKSLIFNKKKDYGILKAMGYSSKDIIHTISFSFLPSVFIGSLFGAFLSTACSQTMVDIVLGAIFGLKNAKLNPDIPLVIIIAICLTAFAFAISMMNAKRIKDITVYTLINE